MNSKEQLVWDLMLDADLSKRYFSHLASQYYKLDVSSKIFVAILSSSSVASWWLWKQNYFENLWQVLSCASALVAISLPFLNWSKKVELAARLKGEYSNLLREYEILWMNVSKLSASRVEEKLKELGKQESDLSLLEDSLPMERKNLVRKIQKEICKSRGLENDR